MPLIVEVHGGPAHHLSWAYDHFRQFLVNPGYGVLAVNFRGSTGYRKAFQAMGSGAYGREMQTDLYCPAAWAVAHGDGDAHALAIMGSSYGGYGAAMAATDPDSPFTAAIVKNAVLDVEHQMRNNPAAWGLNTVYLERYFGRIDRSEEIEDMRRFSPIARVRDQAVPILYLAGKRDGVVGFEQTETHLRDARAADKLVEALIFEDEGTASRAGKTTCAAPARSRRFWPGIWTGAMVAGTRPNWLRICWTERGLPGKSVAFSCSPKPCMALAI